MPTGRRDALILGGAGLVAAAAGAVVGALALQSGSGAAELLGAEFHDLDGRPRRLLEWKGRVLLCNFWATWCEPCREEIPLLVAAKQKSPESGIEFVGIGIDSAAKIREFAKTYQMNYPTLVADAKAINLLRGLGNRAGALPYTLLLDASGAVTWRHLGPLTEASLRQVLASFQR